MPEAREYLEDGQRFERHGVLDRALESYSSAAEACADPELVAEALTHLSRVHRCRSEWEQGIEAARRAQQIARDAKLDVLAHEAVIAEANVLMCRGDFPEALALFQQVLDAQSSPRIRGIALQNMGSILWQQGKLGAAERALAESFGCFHVAGYQLGQAISLNNHGRIALERGNIDLAEQLLEQAREVARSIEDAELIALATVNYAEALEARGDHRRAEEQASTALGYFVTSGNRWREVECLRLIGTVNERLGDRPNAVRCFERALAIAEQIGARQDVQLIRECLSRVGSQKRYGTTDRSPTERSAPL